MRPAYIACFAVLVSAGAAQAQSEAHSREVSLADLDLRAPADVARLQGRVERTAKSLCGPVDYRNAVDRRSFAACVGRSVADAAPLVQAAVNATRTGTQPTVLAVTITP